MCGFTTSNNRIGIFGRTTGRLAIIQQSPNDGISFAPPNRLLKENHVLSIIFTQVCRIIVGLDIYTNLLLGWSEIAGGLFYFGSPHSGRIKYTARTNERFDWMDADHHQTISSSVHGPYSGVSNCAVFMSECCFHTER